MFTAAVVILSAYTTPNWPCYLRQISTPNKNVCKWRLHLNHLIIRTDDRIVLALSQFELYAKMWKNSTHTIHENTLSLGFFYGDAMLNIILHTFFPSHYWLSDIRVSKYVCTNVRVNKHLVIRIWFYALWQTHILWCSSMSQSRINQDADSSSCDDGYWARECVRKNNGTVRSEQHSRDYWRLM